MNTPSVGNGAGPLWVISGSARDPAPMSAFGGKADVIQGVAEGPLLANSGHWRLFGFFDHLASRKAEDDIAPLVR